MGLSTCHFSRKPLQTRKLWPEALKTGLGRAAVDSKPHSHRLLCYMTDRAELSKRWWSLCQHTTPPESREQRERTLQHLRGFALMALIEGSGEERKAEGTGGVNSLRWKKKKGQIENVKSEGRNGQQMERQGTWLGRTTFGQGDRAAVCAHGEERRLSILISCAAGWKQNIRSVHVQTDTSSVNLQPINTSDFIFLPPLFSKWASRLLSLCSNLSLCHHSFTT